MAATSSFTTHSPPDVSVDDHIVAICTVSQSHCNKQALAYHVADFLAFKHLLSRSVPDQHQAWLSACDPRSLDVLRHGTKDVLVAFDEHVVLEQDHRLLMRLFKLSLLQRTSAIWSSGRGKLVILVCGPTSPRQDIIEQIPSDLVRNSPELFRATDVAEIVGDSVNSMLVSPSVYSGGWIIDTALTKGPTHLTSATDRSNHTRLRLARNCAPLFGSQAFNMLTAESSPLRLRPLPNSSLSMLTPDNARRPEADEARNRLQGAIFESCYSLLSCAPRSHVFNFAPDLDNWAHVASPRSGPLLEELHDRWTELPDHQEKPHSNRCYPYYTFGNCKESQKLHLSILAWTARHDEHSRFDGRFLTRLDALLQANTSEYTLGEDRRDEIFKQMVCSLACYEAARNLAEYLVRFVRTTQIATDRGLRDDRLSAMGRKRFLGRLMMVLPDAPKPSLSDHGLSLALSTASTHTTEWTAEYILGSLLGRQQRNTSSEERFQFILKQVAHVTQSLSSLVTKELLTSPWVASAGYGLLVAIRKQPDSGRLFMGRLTGVASGHGAPPSELVPFKAKTIDLEPASHRRVEKPSSSRRVGSQQPHTMKDPDRQRPAGPFAGSRPRDGPHPELWPKDAGHPQRGSAMDTTGVSVMKTSNNIEQIQTRDPLVTSDVLIDRAFPPVAPHRWSARHGASGPTMAPASPYTRPRQRTRKRSRAKASLALSSPERFVLSGDEGAAESDRRSPGLADAQVDGPGSPPLNDREEEYLIDFSSDSTLHDDLASSRPDGK